MGWLIFLAILAALNCLPLGGRIRFDGQNFSAGVLIGKLPIRLYPLPDWLKKEDELPQKGEAEEVTDGFSCRAPAGGEARAAEGGLEAFPAPDSYCPGFFGQPAAEAAFE